MEFFIRASDCVFAKELVFQRNISEHCDIAITTVHETHKAVSRVKAKSLELSPVGFLRVMTLVAVLLKAQVHWAIIGCLIWD